MPRTFFQCLSSVSSWFQWREEHDGVRGHRSTIPSERNEVWSLTFSSPSETLWRQAVWTGRWFHWHVERSRSNSLFHQRCDHISRLNEFIDIDQQKFPEHTLSLQKKKKTSRSVPKTFKWRRPVKRRNFSDTVLFSTMFLTSRSIDEVSLVDDNQFTLTIANETGSLSFIDIRIRWELAQPDSIPIHNQIRPKDVPGTLLNWGSLDPCLRSVMSNLLCALTQTFDLCIEGQWLEECLQGFRKSMIVDKLITRSAEED